MVEMKTDLFKKDYADKLKIAAADIKNDKPKSYVYYFNVDLKFILKARVHLLGKEFDNKIRDAR